METQERICDFCQSSYSVTSTVARNRKYCSKKCQLTSWRRANPKRFHTHQKKYRSQHRSRVKHQQLQAKYNISLDEFNSLLEQQSHRCGVCRRKLFRPHVDHNHVTGDVRGLLCSRCNLALGLLKDSVESCRNAASYLLKPPAIKKSA